MSGQCKKCGYDGCVCDGTDTPETDLVIFDTQPKQKTVILNDYILKILSERDEARREIGDLYTAISKFKEAKGRFNTQLAAERLIAMLPKTLTK